MPHHAYQIVSIDTLLASWNNLPGALTTAGPLQLFLAYTDAPPSASTQRFLSSEAAAISAWRSITVHDVGDRKDIHE